MYDDATSDRNNDKNLYEKLFDEVSEALIGVDRTGKIVLCNKSVETIFGWNVDELIGLPLETLIPERFRQTHVSHVSKFQENSAKSRYMGKANAAITGVHRQGHEINLGTTILRTTSLTGEPLFVAVVRDISERSQYLREIERLANTDVLTGLLNRRYFYEELERRNAEPGARENGYWLGLFDLDGFKSVNDIYGHRAGDMLLREVADRMRQCLPQDCMLARMGGDEFAVMVPAPLSIDDVDKLGGRIVQSVKQPYFIEGSLVSVGVSAGFAKFPEIATTVSGLLERADFSLYNSKRARRGGVSVFMPSSEASIEQKSRLEYCLRSCDLESELYLEFQPIVDLRTNAITHFEALARWASPELGNVSPLSFIPVAERCGKIQEITGILFRKALEEAEKWPETISLSFNLSAQDILSRGSVFRLLRMMLKSHVSPQRLEFEVTETSILTDFEQAEQALKSLSSCGSRIVLDDFGNGYSSYGYIDRLPLNKIKMDRSFVSRLNSSPTALKVIKGIAEFAASLDLDCVAEGVETESDLEKIRSVRVPFAQGYLFSRPVPAHMIPGLLGVQQPQVAKQRSTLQGICANRG